MKIQTIQYSMCLLSLSLASTSSNMYTQNSLVNISSIDPTIIVDLRYASSNNFLQKKFYTDNICYLHKDTAIALQNAQRAFNALGYGLKIWDGYRPLSVQQEFWNACPDERYVTNPAKGGGRHTRATAVDVTLIDLKTGKEVEMPTDFDDFSVQAWIDCKECSIQAKMHRDLLQKIMNEHGFSSVKTEWWHFDLTGWQKYPII